MVAENTVEAELEEIELTPQQKFSQGLREVADFYDAHPTLKTPHDEIFTIFGINDAAELAKVARMFGAADKEVNEYAFTLVKTFPSGQKLCIWTSREKVCKRIKVREEIVPAHVIPAQAETIIEESVREVFEWKCPESILAGGDDAS